MVIFFVVIWKHVWRIIVYKVKEKKPEAGYMKKLGYSCKDLKSQKLEKIHTIK